VPTILIADDNSNIQKMVSLALKGEGIEVIAVGNGEAAVRKLRDISPDVVLADIFMPVRSGYEVCYFVKNEPRLAHVPVVLLAGAFDPIDEREAQRVGADGVLKKPFVPPDPLVTLVKQLIARGGAPQLVGVAAGNLPLNESAKKSAPKMPANAESAGPSAQKISKMVESFGEVVPAAVNSSASAQVDEQPIEPYVAERISRVDLDELMAPTKDPEGTPKPANFGGFSAFPDIVDSASAAPSEPPAIPGGAGEFDWQPTGDAAAPEPETFWPPKDAAASRKPTAYELMQSLEAADAEAAKAKESSQASSAATESEHSPDATPTELQEEIVAETKVVPNYPWQSVAQETTDGDIITETVEDAPAQNSASWYSGTPLTQRDPAPANGTEPGLVPTTDESPYSADPVPVHATSGETIPETSADATDSRVAASDKQESDPESVEAAAQPTEAQQDASAPMDSHYEAAAPTASDSIASTASIPVTAEAAMNALGREVKELARTESGLSQEELVARVASRVIERMQPQVLEVITREVLKPIVEAMVRREIDSM
jgi:CheY-like chemotaxis protein